MTLWNAIIVGLKEIWAHKFRSLLTMLGIILGVSSLVAMSAMVKGIENGAREALIAVGGLQTVRVNPQEVPPEQRHLQDFARGVTLSDVYALRGSVPEIEKIAPVMGLNQKPWEDLVLSANGKMERIWNRSVSGVWPVETEVMQHTVEYGRMFNELDDEFARSVCVIGTEIRNKFWGDPDVTGKEVVPLGKTLLINNYPFTIIGMFERYEGEQQHRERLLKKAEDARLSAAGLTNGPPGGGRRRERGRRNFDAFTFKNNTVYVPLNTMWVKLVSGVTNVPSEPRLNNIEIRIRDVSYLDRALTEIRNVLMINHRGVEDFSFMTQEDWAETANLQIQNARISGSIISGISLLVGGIGIMNIMLASISERVREIGIRKAVGAGGVDVFVQIVVESMVIAVIGGAVGLAASLGLLQIISYVSPTGNAPILTVSAMVIAFGASAMVGVLAGLFPAVKAARMNVIQSLRYD